MFIFHESTSGNMFNGGGGYAQNEILDNHGNRNIN
jgi:hypothetical protein